MNSNAGNPELNINEEEILDIPPITTILPTEDKAEEKEIIDISDSDEEVTPVTKKMKTEPTSDSSDACSDSEFEEFEELLRAQREKIERMRAQRNTPQDEETRTTPQAEEVHANKASTSNHTTAVEDSLLGELIEASNELGRSIQNSLDRKTHLDKIIKAMIDGKEKQG